MNQLTALDWYYISLAVIIFGCLCVGFLMGYGIGETLGYRRGIEHVTESILEAEIIGEVDLPDSSLVPCHSSLPTQEGI